MNTPYRADPTHELRMYFLVMYNLSGIQQGIQAGHAAIEYQVKYMMPNDRGLIATANRLWATDHKTFMVLNGGTSNQSAEQPGTMEQHLKWLNERDVPCAAFNEPDLNGALSAIAFILDGRVFDRALYPDFKDFPYVEQSPARKMATASGFDATMTKLQWIEWVGGPEVCEMREWVSRFRLA